MIQVQELVKTLPRKTRMEIEENLIREPLSVESITRTGMKIEDMLKKQALQRKKDNLKHGEESPEVGNLPTSGKGKSREAVGAIIGMSEKTYRKAKEVLESGDKKLIEEMNKKGKVEPIYKKLFEKEKARAEKEEQKTPTRLKYNVIVIDPPYTEMSLGKIKSVQVRKLAEPSCMVWLWATPDRLPDALALLKHWGFQYKNMLTWEKDTATLSTYFNIRTEHCLMAVWGNPTTVPNEQGNIIRGSSIDGQKPETFYRMIEGICQGNRLQVFNAMERHGWDTYKEENE